MIITHRITGVAALVPVLLLFGGAVSVRTHGQSLCDVKAFRVNSVKGRVVSDSRKGLEPIENAQVVLRTIDGREDVIKTVLAGQDGSFEINGIKDGKYSVTVSKRDWKFVDYYFTVNKKNRAPSGVSLLIRLGVSALEPCGGGSVRAESNHTQTHGGRHPGRVNATNAAFSF
jgi:hypothetical protein